MAELLVNLPANQHTASLWHYTKQTGNTKAVHWQSTRNKCSKIRKHNYHPNTRPEREINRKTYKGTGSYKLVDTQAYVQKHTGTQKCNQTEI